MEQCRRLLIFFFVSKTTDVELMGNIVQENMFCMDKSNLKHCEDH